MVYLASAIEELMPTSPDSSINRCPWWYRASAIKQLMSTTDSSIDVHGGTGHRLQTAHVNEYWYNSIDVHGGIWTLPRQGNKRVFMSKPPKKYILAHLLAAVINRILDNNKIQYTSTYRRCSTWITVSGRVAHAVLGTIVFLYECSSSFSCWDI